MRLPRSRLIALAILVGAGCGTTAHIEENNAPSIDLSSYETIRIEVSSSVGSRDRDVQMIESLTTARLAGLGLFQRVTAASRTPNDSSPLILKCTIVDMRDVTPTDRVARGYSAGAARVRLRVEVVAGRKTLDKFFVEGVGFGDMFGGSTDTAIDLSVKRIVEYVTATKSH